MSLESELQSYLQRFAMVARVEIGGNAVQGFMVDAPDATGPNLSTGEGTLRRITGALARTFIDQRSPESIFSVDIAGTTIRIEIGSKKEYAAVHEFGFEGSVNVPAHTRTITQAFGRQISPTQVDVSSYTRNMNIPKRPYLLPAIENKQEVLREWLLENGAVLMENLDD